MQNITLPSISNLPFQSLSIIYLAPMLSSSSAKSKFECHTCGKQFTRKSTLKRHLLVHSRVKEYSCKVCCKSFSRKDVLLKHKESRKCTFNSLTYNSNGIIDSGSSDDGEISSLSSLMNSPASTSVSLSSFTSDYRMNISWLLSNS
jgi:uncharacterized Zn-finger protein